MNQEKLEIFLLLCPSQAEDLLFSREGGAGPHFQKNDTYGLPVEKGVRWCSSPHNRRGDERPVQASHEVCAVHCPKTVMRMPTSFSFGGLGWPHGSEKGG